MFDLISKHCCPISHHNVSCRKNPLPVFTQQTSSCFLWRYVQTIQISTYFRYLQVNLVIAIDRGGQDTKVWNLFHYLKGIMFIFPSAAVLPTSHATKQTEESCKSNDWIAWHCVSCSVCMYLSSSFPWITNITLTPDSSLDVCPIYHR